jgi:hypothetical protein
MLKNSRVDRLRVKGADKTAYLISLRETLKSIFDSYREIKPDLLYEVLIPEEDEKNKLPIPLEKKATIMLPDEVIGWHLQEDRPYFDAANKREILLDRTGNAYGMSTKKMKAIMSGRNEGNRQWYAFIIIMTALFLGAILIGSVF